MLFKKKKKQLLKRVCFLQLLLTIKILYTYTENKRLLLQPLTKIK